MDHEFDYVGLQFNKFLYSPDDDEPSRFVHGWSGKLTLYDDAADKERPIGTFNAIYIDVEGAVAERESVADVFDSTQVTLGYFEDLYDYDELTFRQEITDAACPGGHLWSPNLLILDRLIIEPKWRGKGRGLVALRGLIQLLRPGAGLIAMKPFPLQNEAHFMDADGASERKRLRLDDFPSRHRVATAALCRYYGRLGFKRVPKTDYMVCDPDQRLPSVDELRSPPPASARRMTGSPTLRLSRDR